MRDILEALVHSVFYAEEAAKAMDGANFQKKADLRINMINEICEVSGFNYEKIRYEV